MRFTEEVPDEFEGISRPIVDIAVLFEELDQGLGISQVAVAVAAALSLQSLTFD